MRINSSGNDAILCSLPEHQKVPLRFKEDPDSLPADLIQVTPQVNSIYYFLGIGPFQRQGSARTRTGVFMGNKSQRVFAG
jgi:hypothetical protein